jgi:hypothetical protein
MITRSEKLAAEIERLTGTLRAMKRELFTVRREEAAARVCCQCRKAVMAHHKWHYVPFSKATGISHRNCKDPESYK